MKAIYLSVDNNISRLIQKGFDSKSLRSFIGLDGLKGRIELIIAEAHLYMSIGSHPFKIPLTGFFNEDNDVVKFDFSFQYHPEGKKLTLNEVEVGMNGMFKTYRLADAENDLPTSSALYEQISEKVRVNESKSLPLQERVHLLGPAVHRKITSVSLQQADKLFQKGYLVKDGAELTNVQKFADSLRDKLLVMKVQQPHSVNLTVINTRKADPNNAEIMSSRMAYEFNTFTDKATLLGIDARLGNDRKIIIPRNFSQVPVAGELQNHLSNPNRATSTAIHFGNAARQNTRPKKRSAK